MELSGGVQAHEEQSGEMRNVKTKTSSKPSHDPRFGRFLRALALRVLTLRRRQGDTMDGLARACNVTRGTIHKVEHPQEGEDISLGTVWCIAQHFGMPLEKLLDGLDATGNRVSPEGMESGIRSLNEEDYLALSLVPEETALQLLADLAEQACLVAKDESQLEILAQHSARLRQRRYSLLLKRRETEG